MWRQSLATLLTVVIVAGLTADVGDSQTSAPPRGLSEYGRLVWNFEGLLTRTLGSPNACEAAHNYPSLNWTLSACKLANAYQIDWQVVFVKHSATAYSTVASRPPDLGNVAPIRIAGLYVRCSSSTWLVENGLGIWFCLGA